MNLIEEIKKVRNNLDALADADAFGVYQLGFRAGVLKAFEMVDNLLKEAEQDTVCNLDLDTNTTSDEPDYAKEVA